MPEPHTHRPNRWTGPPSTWRTYTKEERNVISSLDTVRSQDLSIHLYNAHAIKSRLRANRKGKGKAKVEEESEFVPPDLWTAWPMPADEVPRGPYMPNMGARDSWRRAEDVRPSANLEEALLAAMSRTARETWRSRKWEWTNGKAEAVIKKEAVAKDLISNREEGIEDENVLPDRPMFSSQAADALGIDSSPMASSSEENAEANNDDNIDVERRPVPLVDDDQVRQIILPSVRHIISKVDDLLEGLHKARKAYAGNWNKPKMGNTTTGKDTDTGAGTSRSRACRKSRQPTKRARSASVDSEASARSIASVSSGGRQKPKLKQLKLRDWSDVLGMAALTGWDADVVQRAAERCSRLFGEDMLFRTFEEGGKGEKSGFIEHLASGAKVQDSDDEGIVEMKDEKPYHQRRMDEVPSSSPPVIDSAIRCPVRTCPSHGHVYARAKNMYDHVRQKHPEVDIPELKKLESKRRGDQRGKWHRFSRHRSSSMASMSST